MFFSPIIMNLSNICTSGALVFLTREPGKIVGPIASLMGIIYNVIFNMVYTLIQPGSLGITIILFTVLIKLILLPLSIHQQKSMMVTQQLQPEVQKIQEKYAKLMKGKKDPELQQKMSMEMSELYRKNKTSPFSGCLPLLLQFPILIALFNVFRSAYRYIHVVEDIYLQLADAVYAMGVDTYLPLLNPIGVANGFAGVNIGDNPQNMVALLFEMSSSDWTGFLESAGAFAAQFSPLLEQKHQIEYFFGISLIENPALAFPAILIPIAAGASTFIQTKLLSNSNPQMSQNPAMATQQKVMNYMMPALMAFMSFTLPAGLGLYWTISNLFSLAQNYLIKKFFTRKPEKEVS